MGPRQGTADRKAALERLRPWLERARAFKGWDLSSVPVRPLGPGPQWDYGALVRQVASRARSLLDMGTGGGEFLSGLREALPRRTVATEEWDVNAPLASRRLAPLGADVVRCKSVRLPFVDGAFDVVVNRHEELDPAEVARVLSSNGLLITQQVGRHDWQELRRFIPRMTDWGDLRGRYTAALESLGFRVKSQESERKVAYASLGAFVFMLCIAPWTIPNFDVEQDLDALLGLEAECTTDKGLVLTECRFLITAEKMNESTAMSQ